MTEALGAGGGRGDVGRTWPPVGARSCPGVGPPDCLHEGPTGRSRAAVTDARPVAPPGGGASPVSTAGGRASPGRTGTAHSPLHLLPNKTPDLQRDSFFSFHCHLQERKSSPSPDEGRAWGASRESGAPCHGARWPEPSRSPGEVSPVSRAGSRPGRRS